MYLKIYFNDIKIIKFSVEGDLDEPPKAIMAPPLETPHPKMNLHGFSHQNAQIK